MDAKAVRIFIVEAGTIGLSACREMRTRPFSSMSRLALGSASTLEIEVSDAQKACR